ncbi:M14 family zinc carboxypeptidase [Virgibacillus oceani]
MGHFGSDTVNEWAWFAVGTDGMSAPRAPEGFLPAPEEPDKVTGVNVEQDYGFATVTWDPLDETSEYEIERTLMSGNEPDDLGQVVGRWFPNRYTNNELTFADSGFVLGEEYQWRVRAVSAGIPGEWSDPVVSDTQQPIGPDQYRTEFEINGGAEWTSHNGEQQLLQEIAENSDRVNLETVGQTAQGRPLNLLIIGDPVPSTPEEIANSPSVLVNCTIHGTEPAPREACLMLLRDLAFSDDERVSDVLEDTTVLIAPTANPDGRAVNSRENSAGQDLNRDHLLLRHPETFALAEVMRDYQPDLVIDGHEYQAAGTSDLSAMWARSPNVGEDIWALSQDIMTRGELFGSATNAGWWPLQYPLTPSDGWEALLQNTAGLKNHVGLLVETRRRPGPTRPAEGDENTLVTTPENQQRRVYTQLWSFRQMLDFYQENIPAIQQAIINTETAASNNEGPVYLDGMRDVPVTPPVNRPPTMILDPAPCGYLIDENQYTNEDGQTPSVRDRLNAHGIEVEQINEGIFVSMEQPLRGLIPLLLDSEFSHGMVSAERIYDCEDLIPDPTNAAEIKDLVEHFNEEGEFKSDEAVRLLATHLSAVSHYENQEEGEKVVRHMGGFQDLLDYQQENDLISQKAFDELYAQSDSLINQWK